MKILILFLLLFNVSFSANAQDYLKQDDFSAGSDIILESEDEIIGDLKGDDITIIEDKHKDTYLKPTLVNISRLYWKKNALEIDNDTAIDNFLRINECDIYDKFFADDFEWLRIREAAREMIKAGKENFSHKFKVTVPIDLGRYDQIRRGFPLINKTAFRDLRRVEIGGNSYSEDICGQEGVIEHYPRNLILILNKPFTFDFVKLDEHIAQAFIVRQKYQETLRPRELQNRDYDRLAYARIRITFSEFQGVTKGRDNFPLGIMFGKLDGIDIFEDPFEKRMLASFDYR
jgi:hypothetical protein